MINDFVMVVGRSLFKMFGIPIGAKIFRVFCRIYYGGIYYPQIYWLEIGNVFRRLRLGIMRIETKILIFLIELKRK